MTMTELNDAEETHELPSALLLVQHAEKPVEEPAASNAYEQAALRLRARADALMARAQEARDQCYERADEFVEWGRQMDEYIASEEEYLNSAFKHLAELPLRLAKTR